MSITAKSPQASETDDVRSYILGMLIELAELADRVEEHALAGHLRDLVWPPALMNRFSGPAKL